MLFIDVFSCEDDAVGDARLDLGRRFREEVFAMDILFACAAFCTIGSFVIDVIVFVIGRASVRGSKKKAGS